METWTKHAVDGFSEVRAAPTDVSTLANPSVIKVATIEELGVPVPPRTRTLIETGDDPDQPVGSDNPRYPSRSELSYAAMTGLARLGVDAHRIAGIFINPDYKVSDRFLERTNPPRQALKEAERACIAVSDEWPDVFKNGNPRPTFPNAYAAVIRLGVNCSYDIFKNRLMVGSIPVQQYAGELNDKLVTIIRKAILDQFGFDPYIQNVRDALETFALENTVHQIKQYLEGLKWDGTPRLRRFFYDYMGAENNELNRAIAFIMFVAAVRRIYQPGCKFDTMVVWEGKQGTGKSTALKLIAGEEYFSDQDIIAADSKTQMELLEGVWIYEVCELSGMRHTDVGKIKSFLSRQEDRGRPAYGRYKEVIKRQSIFVGTTNDETYLKDKTGNRRYLPVRTRAIDLKSIERDRDQLWAEACYWEAKDASIVLPEELWQAAAREQASRVYQDPWEDLLASIEGEQVGREHRVFTKSLLAHLEIPSGQQQHFQTSRLADCMRNLGWNGPKKLRIDGKTLNGYWRATDDEGDGDAVDY